MDFENPPSDPVRQMEAWLELEIESPMTPRVTQTVAALREDLDLAEGP